MDLDLDAPIHLVKGDDPVLVADVVRELVDAGGRTAATGR